MLVSCIHSLCLLTEGFQPWVVKSSPSHYPVFLLISLVQISVCCLLCCPDDVARLEAGLLTRQQQFLTSSEECAAAVAAATIVLVSRCSPSWPLIFIQHPATHITSRSQLVHCSLPPFLCMILLFHWYHLLLGCIIEDFVLRVFTDHICSFKEPHI